MTPKDHDDHEDHEESEKERTTRRWNEMLQELRVAQTGVQVLTGFLLTVPFSQRFSDLDPTTEDAYLVTVCSAVLAAGLLIAPVAFHRGEMKTGNGGVLDPDPVRDPLGQPAQSGAQHQGHGRLPPAQAGGDRIARGGDLAHNSIPAIDAEVKAARLPAIMARNPNPAISLRRSGASPPMPAI